MSSRAECGPGSHRSHGASVLDVAQQDWGSDVHSLGLEQAVPLGPARRPARRVYRAGGDVVKVDLFEPGLGSVPVALEFQALLFCLGVPGVPRPRHLIQVPTGHALVLEAIEGRRLDQCRKKAPLPTVLRRLAALLVRVSMRGIAHNDIQARNVIVGPTGTVALVDFDQATEHPRLAALIRNLIGARPGACEPAYGSLLSLAVQEALVGSLPRGMYRRLHAVARKSVYRLREAPTRPYKGLSRAKVTASRTPSTARQLSTPVLLIMYNRPELTVEVLQQLRHVRPATMFVAADGPYDRGLDAERCQATRRLVRLVDWPCDIHTLFQAENLGCKGGPETAITWFLDAVGSGIILEDDCVPSVSFFRYSAELLQRYHNDDRIMMISGTNRLGVWKDEEQSYHFSRLPSVCGWATWRRAWEKHDPLMTRWADPAVRSRIKKGLSKREYALRRRQFEQVARGLDAWDWPWAFTRLLHEGLSVVPSRNLVANIGYRSSATHTKRRRARGARLAAFELGFPLAEPALRSPDADFDAAVCAMAAAPGRRALQLLPPRAPRRVKQLLW